MDPRNERRRRVGGALRAANNAERLAAGLLLAGLLVSVVMVGVWIVGVIAR